MVFKLTISIVLLISLTALGSADKAESDHLQPNLHSETVAGKRSKRDSIITPDVYQDGAGAPGGDMIPPGVRDMLNNPAVMQALYDRAKAENDEIENGIGDDDAGVFTSPYMTKEDAAVGGGEDGDESASKRSRLFVGKRRLFVGKRRLFVGKRRLFVGKRQRLFVGKRPQPTEKRQRLFVGKRAPRLFVGKRQRLFVGKRDWQANMQRRLQELLEQKDLMGADFQKRFREFVGKRYGYLSDFEADKRPQRMFIGKRDDYAQMLQRVQDLAKRARLFVGKRDYLVDSYPANQDGNFPEKRQDEIVNAVDMDGQADDQDDKRSSRMFVGKRAASTVPYELAEKRHRYFVGKRDAGLIEGDVDKERDTQKAASSPKDEDFSDLKRSREFVGRR